MNLGQLFDIILLGAVVLAALLGVCMKKRGAATAIFLVFGVLLALLWARFNAPDIALAEAALGGGIAGALLVDALERRRPVAIDSSPTTHTPGIVIAAIAGAGSLAMLLEVTKQLDFAPGPLAAAALAETGRTGVSHPVTAVLLSYRSLDTLLEIAVLTIAAFAARALGHERVLPVPHQDPIRRVLALFILPVLALLVMWVLVAGTSRPGGAFQAGALLGAGLMIAHLCGVPISGLCDRAGLRIIGASLGVFIAAGAAGLVWTGWWLGFGSRWAGAVILALETVLTIGIGTALAMIFLSAGARDADKSRDSAVPQ